MFYKGLKMKEINLISHFIFEKSGVSIPNYLTRQTLTRSSCPDYSRAESNEVLEFYGDSCLSHITTKKIYQHFGVLKYPRTYEDDFEVAHVVQSHESNFSSLRNQIVSNESLAKIIDKWADEDQINLIDYLQVGKCDIDNSIEKVRKIKSDTFEAIVGAIAVKCKFDDKLIENAVSRLIPFESIFQEYDKAHTYHPEEMNLDNAISTLEIMADKGYCSRPKYSGNSDMLPGEWPWHKTCSIKEWNLDVTVLSTSKANAKKAAAYTILILKFNLNNEYGPNSDVLFWRYKNGKLIPDNKTGDI